MYLLCNVKLPKVYSWHHSASIVDILQVENSCGTTNKNENQKNLLTPEEIATTDVWQRSSSYGERRRSKGDDEQLRREQWRTVKKQWRR
ncbi:hypothetical protein L1887_09560 [Cichorium endivia]|nr:hypothetical protein L1887_09560 [Cichorium endivia]